MSCCARAESIEFACGFGARGVNIQDTVFAIQNPGICGVFTSYHQTQFPMKKNVFYAVLCRSTAKTQKTKHRYLQCFLNLGTENVNSIRIIHTCIYALHDVQNCTVPALLWLKA